MDYGLQLYNDRDITRMTGRCPGQTAEKAIYVNLLVSASGPMKWLPC